MKYSVIVPVYNSENTLQELANQIISYFESKNMEYEIIFVEDGGKDSSWGILKKLAKQQKHISAIKLSRNYGQHNAIYCGMHYVTGDFVITLDDDLQVKPKEIDKLISTQQKSNCDMVYGIFKKRKHSSFRNLGSWLIQKVFKKIFNNQKPLTFFRIIKYEIIKQCLHTHTSFIFIDGMLQWQTNNIEYVYVEHNPRENGRSGYTLGKLISLASNLLFTFSILPLRWLTYFGFLSSVISFCLLLFYIIKKLLYNVQPGFTSIIVMLMFIVSFFSLVLGIMGEYIMRIYISTNKKPAFTVDNQESQIQKKDI